MGSKHNKKTAVKSKQKEFPTPSVLVRLFRGSIVLLCLIFALLFVGSKIISKQLLLNIQRRSLASTSLVAGRTIDLRPQVNIKNIRLINRLQRLGYQKISSSPSHPGQYRISEQLMEIYMRQVQLPSGQEQPAGLVRIRLNGNTILELEDEKFNEKLPYYFVEPEILSLFGDKASRATSPKTLEEFPDHLVKAVLAIEDERFYQHFGVDPIAIARAIFINLQSGAIRQGGSTLTQQLAKNVFFSNERSLVRKISEALMALMIEMSFPKKQILEFYLNEVFLGQEGLVAIHGFGEAAQSFFGKDISNISISEAATLAGIIKAPSAYSPRNHPEQAQKRRQIVLEKMRDLNVVTEDVFVKALRENIRIIPAQRIQRQAPYFVDYVRKELASVLDAHAFERKFLHIHTGLDAEYQRCAGAAMAAGIQKLEREFPKFQKKKYRLQGALVSVSTADKQIRAYVGGRDYSENQFCRVSMAKRQPGSAFKPFVYLTALDGNLNNYRAATVSNLLVDEPVTIHIPGVGDWQPKNYDEKFRGEVTLREALTYSLNIPTVELAQKVGIDSVEHTAKLFGFGDNLPRVPSLALGAGEVTPLEMARAYLGLANGGLLSNIISTISITENERTDPIFVAQNEERRVSAESAVYVLTNMMQSVIENGTGRVIRNLGFHSPAAGKTGTSNDTRDAWFAGYTPTLLTIVWIGLDNNEELGLTGGKAAAPIWAEYMKCVNSMEPNLDFVVPEGVVFRDIDANTGQLFSSECSDQSVMEVFVAGTEPEQTCMARNGFSSSDKDVASAEDTEDRVSQLNFERVKPRVRVRKTKDFGDTEQIPSHKNRKGSSFWNSIWSSD
ncbi:MAG: PBP1A family penicillin-binding protein [Deltaproteobacteria bacterium]|nr:PBP1A family penicillin-binding protein [Deltaproteobacteria bacterium]